MHTPATWVGSTARFRVAHLDLELLSDDRAFVDECSSLFGGDATGATSAPRATLVAELRRRERGVGELLIRGDERLAELSRCLLSLASSELPFRELARGTGRSALAWGGEAEAFLTFEAGRCLFRTRDRWRRVLAHVLFLRMLLERDDALCFHAASLDLRGRGLLLVGPKGSGKSTLALALAARGHALLGDETACYLPASGTLEPCERPVAIKPGPQAAAVSARLRGLAAAPDADGVRRVPIRALFPSNGARAVRLAAVVFLRGFGRAPALVPVQPGRAELSLLQPLVGTLVHQPARRVFEMVRLLAGVTTHHLVVAGPEATAVCLEQALAA